MKTTATSAHSDLVKELQGALEGGRVIVVAGAGVSIAATGGDSNASWTGLLENGITYCVRTVGCSNNWEQGYRHLLKANQLEAVAEGISEALDFKNGDGAYAKWIGETIGKLEAKASQILEAVQGLNVPILTTNYDSLLTKACNLDPIVWKDDNLVNRWVRGERKGVLHLHGYWERPKSIVFGIRSYEEIRQNQVVKNILRTLATDKTLLFIGCGPGLDDTNLGAFRTWLQEVHKNSSHEHYLLVLGNELEETRKRFPQKGRIRPVAYGDDYAELPAFLERIAPEKRTLAPSLPSIPHNREIQEYLKTAESLYEDVELPGFEEAKLRVPIQLEDLHVPLHAMVDQRISGRTQAGSADEMAAEMRDSSDLPLIDAFRRAEKMGGRRGLVILGDPGAGKTTHLKRLLLKVGRDGGTDLGLNQDILPVFLPLRELRDLKSGLDAFLQAQLDDNPHFQVERDFAGRFLQRGRSLFLLDGLDEIPRVEDRQRVVEWVEKALKTHRDSHFVVTCRYAGYRSLREHFSGRFLELHLRPLNEDQAKQFIHNWFRVVELGLGKTEVLARERAEELIERLKEPDFRAARVFALTRNPLLLTAICLVHRDRGSLPHRRADLYEECVNVLLERWRNAKKLKTKFDAKRAKRVLQPAAYWLHGEEGRIRATTDEFEPVLAEGLTEVGEDPESAERFLKTICNESGLLTGWSDNSFGFMHLGFQEYLVAREIRRRYYEDETEVLTQLAQRFGQSWWREVTLLLLGLEEPSVFKPLLAEVVQTLGFVEHKDLVENCLEDAIAVSLQPLLDLLNQEASKNEQNLWNRQLAALRIVRERAPEQIEKLRLDLAKHPFEEIRETVKPSVVPATTKSPVKESGLPTLRTAKDGSELILIAGGTFLMGSTKKEQKFWAKGDKNYLRWFAEESPQHQVTLSDFYLSKFPVTNAQYGEYLKENDSAKEPESWADSQYNQPKQPVVGVSWEDAQAYCEWAGVQLPTEAQWEYACRAGTTTAFWSGEIEAELEKIAWYRENSGGKPEPVGEKPANPWGLYDMHGNVWEWCQDWYGKYAKKATKDPTGPRRGSSRVIRGGSFWNGARRLRAAYRDGFDPSDRGCDLGFRVALPAAGD